MGFWALKMMDLGGREHQSPPGGPIGVGRDPIGTGQVDLDPNARVLNSTWAGTPGPTPKELHHGRTRMDPGWREVAKGVKEFNTESLD